MNRTTLRNVLVVILSLAVLAFIGYLAYGRIVGNRVTPLAPAQSSVSDTGRYDIPADETPALLPNDLPIPDDAALVESFELATKDGDVQGTRSYVSTRSLADERAAYEAYVTRAGWTVVDRQEAAGYAAILAEHDSRQLLISFSSRTGKTHVTVSAVAAPATN